MLPKIEYFLKICCEEKMQLMQRWTFMSDLNSRSQGTLRVVTCVATKFPTMSLCWKGKLTAIHASLPFSKWGNPGFRTSWKLLLVEKVSPTSLSGQNGSLALLLCSHSSFCNVKCICLFVFSLYEAESLKAEGFMPSIVLFLVSST
jgi:hypothetical protein